VTKITGEPRLADLKIVVAGDGISDERVAAATRDLLKDIRADTDPRARLATSESSIDSKGDPITLGQIALSLVTGGPLSKLIECLFGFLGRNKKLVIEVQNKAGETLKLDMDFVNREGSKSAMAIVERFLARA
jgi:hypothetical protein